MTPEKKAKELVRQFYSIGAIECKQCALIAVDEIIKEIYLDQYYSQKRVNYYNEVKQEIEKL